MAYKEDSEYRKEIFDWQTKRYKRLFPEAEIVIGEDDTGNEYFCKARAINNAVRDSKHDKLFIVDIDLAIEKPAIQKGIRLINNYCYIIPYGQWWRLSEKHTRRILDNEIKFYVAPDGRLCDVHPRRGTGIHILTKKNFYAAGGYDERFIGWGGEDNAFGCALKTLCKGAPKILKQYNSYHLWHPSQSTKGKKMRKENVRLWRAYQSAMRNKDMMQDLINSRTW